MITLPADIVVKQHYDVLIGINILNAVGERLRKCFPEAKKCFIVTDDQVAAFYEERVSSSLKAAHFDTFSFVFNRQEVNDENMKSIDSVQMFYKKLFDIEFNRFCPLIALGGGVIGDIVGFVASTFHRGVPFVYCPTSLLAQVDSSIGGKTALHFNGITNVIGTFYQPALVVADIATLTTLTDREFWSGFAELLKVALIADENLLETIVKKGEEIKKRDLETLQVVIAKAMDVKLKLVEKDVQDHHGTRILLNYGHTLGQAFETIANHNQLRHGEAVALGMVGAAWIGNRLGMTPSSYCKRQEDLIRFFELPTRFSVADLGWKFSREDFMEKIKKIIDYDKKKVTSQGIRFVLPKRVGSGMAVNVDDFSIVKHAVQNLLSW